MCFFFVGTLFLLCKGIVEIFNPLMWFMSVLIASLYFTDVVGMECGVGNKKDRNRMD